MKLPASIANIKIDDYSYGLTDDRIAKYPLNNRDQSKLLVWKNQSITDDVFANMVNHLPSESLLVFNNTKVIRARLLFKKHTGATIEIFVLDPHSPADYAQNFQQTGSCEWKCVVGNLKKWKSGTLAMSLTINGQTGILAAHNIGESGKSRIIRFEWDHEEISFAQVLETAGNIPIPPYLHRESEELDLVRYQTVYSKIKGSVAAPTAGLHFTDSVFESIKKKGISTAELTLHVGAGTFKPVQSESIEGHEMHTEHISIPSGFLKNLIDHQRQVVAVGTTSVRTLESLYWIGAKIIDNPNASPSELAISQWEAYTMKTQATTKDALHAIIEYLEKFKLNALNTSTQIIIVPGYQFRVIDGMLTNFHQPKSTLLLLISAYTGEAWKEIYQHALNYNYRFLSYGDSNLYLR
ncbi:MAG: S-adenosylmethionine:tRNA ribosyltransferase-isomerase [Prolixibacteraceae bacterium]|nr:S-adenosylmethionine:tRNA ribosyltransferase-isomerase [Prolixibacteraceae bacterium]